MPNDSAVEVVNDQAFYEWWKTENPDPWENAEFQAWAKAAWEASEKRFSVNSVEKTGNDIADSN